MIDSNISQETEYKQISMTIRHCSNIRFLIIPIFFGINGALFIAIQNDKINIILCGVCVFCCNI